MVTLTDASVQMSDSDAGARPDGTTIIPAIVRGTEVPEGACHALSNASTGPGPALIPVLLAATLHVPTFEPVWLATAVETSTK
jgi:hypothetical protein